tara:strand:+ start:900 stop:1448 length:549 start_codon:yes stop_codon:yes gene_type:complete
MTLKYTPICEFGKKIVDFSLSDFAGRNFSLSDCIGNNGTLIMFICNHCPYVKAIIKEIVKTTNEIRKFGINSLAIMPNDYDKYKEDSPNNMLKFSKLHNFYFPYLVDEEQIISKQFEAVCTPEFFGYNSNNELQYRGRLTELNNLKVVNNKNELLDAMMQIATNQIGPRNQFPSMGCSIKWK